MIKKLMRLIWKIACIPLELLRAVFMAFAWCIRSIALPRGFWFWLAFLAVVYNTIPKDQGALYSEAFAHAFLWGGGLLLIGRTFPDAFLHVSMGRAWWRLGPPRIKPRKKLETPVALVVAEMQGKDIGRKRMTARLSPELQALIRSRPEKAVKAA